MADEEEGMLSQADLDALIAAAQAEPSAGIDRPLDEPEDVPPPPTPEAEAAPVGGGSGLVDLPRFDPPAPSFSTAEGASGLVRVRDIPLEVTVELGRTRLLIRDILDLTPGAIIELDKVAGEPVDLFANGMLVARGEVIVIDDNFGVRVTEIITAADRKGAEKDRHALAA